MLNSGVDHALHEGLLHHQSGRLDHAERIYQEILKIDPNCAWACYLLGALSNQLGRPQAGLELIMRSLQLGLRAPEQMNHLGECYRALGQFEDAIVAYNSALQMNPQQIEAMLNLGVVLTQLNRFAESLPVLERVISFRSDQVEAHYTYCFALNKVGRFSEAKQQCELILQLEPEHKAATIQMAIALQHLGHIERAVEVLAELVENHPTFVQGYFSYAMALCQLGNLDLAVATAERAVELVPNQADAVRALAWLYSAAARWEEAVTAMRKAIQLSPNDRSIHVSLAGMLLRMGEYIEGFQEMDWRQEYCDIVAKVHSVNKKLWDGTDLAGKTILLHGEQGSGDIIQFARFIPLLAETGARVDVFVWKELASILKSLHGISNVVSPDSVDIDQYDFHFPLLSLPRIFRTTINSIPSNIPYLHADTSYLSRWKSRIDAHARGLKVGIVWAGSAQPDPYRSCSMNYVSRLADVPNVSWYSLQVGEHRDALQSAPPQMNILDLGKDFGSFKETAELVSEGRLPALKPLDKDFADTAAVLSQMDLIITIDTSVAHLAGALGLRTWVMLPFAAGWLWMPEGDRTPWYPTLKLFRQKKLNDWGPVIEQIRSELMELVKTRQ